MTPDDFWTDTVPGIQALQESLVTDHSVMPTSGRRDQPQHRWSRFRRFIERYVIRSER